MLREMTLGAFIGGYAGFYTHTSFNCSPQKILEGAAAGVAAVALEKLMGDTGFYLPIIIFTGRVVVEIGLKFEERYPFPSSQ